MSRAAKALKTADSAHFFQFQVLDKLFNYIYYLFIFKMLLILYPPSCLVTCNLITFSSIAAARPGLHERAKQLIKFKFFLVLNIILFLVKNIFTRIFIYKYVYFYFAEISITKFFSLQCLKMES